MQTRKDLINLMLAISLVMGFVFISSFAVFYIRETYGVGETCGCGLTPSIILVLLSSAGVFVGTITYYLLAKSFFKEKKHFKQDVEKTLSFLDPEGKEILEAVIRRGGSVAQSKLSRVTSMSAVKIHRRLDGLVKKGVLKKEKKGMTNMILLDDDLKRIFLE
ncbi:MAG: hypothetical protein ACLFO2_00710 [Candidatus Woesearchaeota archaeon]